MKMTLHYTCQTYYNTKLNSKVKNYSLKHDAQAAVATFHDANCKNDHLKKRKELFKMFVLGHEIPL